jgi:hypothetical protein
MPGWISDAPVVMRVTAEQAQRLQQDWYYRYARFEEQAGGDVLMTIADSEPEGPLELLRWLGPGAEPSHRRGARWRGNKSRRC